MRRLFVLFSGLVAVVALAACGGGSTTPFRGVNPSPTASAGVATVQFALTVPTGAESVTITLVSVNGSTPSSAIPTVVNLSSTTSGCTGSGSSLACTVSVTAPAGSDSFTILAYAGASGQGTLLGGASATVTAQAGQTADAPSATLSTAFVTEGQATYALTGSYSDYGLGATPGPSTTEAPSTETEAWTTGASFGGVNDLLQVATTLSEGGTFDEYALWTASGSTLTLGSVGLSEAEDPGTPYAANFTETCASPYQPLFITGASTWSAYAGTGACVQLTQGVGYTGSDQETTQADGSYVVLGSFTASGSTQTYSTTVNSNGSAIETANYGVSGATVTEIYTPAPNAPTIPEYVASYASPAPSPLPTPGPANTTVPNWYAPAGLANGVPPSPLQSGTYTVSQITSLPGSCAVPASLLGSSPSFVEVALTGYVFDPTGIYLNDNDQEYLLNGLGVVCIVDQSIAASPSGASTSIDVESMTQSTLTAALRSAGFAKAMQSQSETLLLAAQARRERTLQELRHTALLRRLKSVR